METTYNFPRVAALSSNLTNCTNCGSSPASTIKDVHYVSWVGIGLGITCVVLLSIFMVYCGIRAWKKKKRDWLINSDEIKIECEDLTGAQDMTGFYKDEQESILKSMISMCGTTEARIDIGKFHGENVCVKRVRKTIDFELNKQLVEEILFVHTLDHPNLCQFIGITVDPPAISLVTEYCTKGCLKDVLENQEVEVNWDFKLSFATDIVSACAYLHQHRLFHGRIKSTNCLIDDKWDVKVSDFGLWHLRQQMPESIANHTMINEAIYLPPEARNATSRPKPVPSTDTYSIGVLLVEIANREPPYPPGWLMVSSWKPPCPELPNPPHSPEKDYKSEFCPDPKKYCTLVKMCLEDEPLDRPTCDTVKKALGSICGEKRNKVDLLISKMKTYTSILEDIIEERNIEVLVERTKTDAFLHSLLPAPLVDDLKHGKPASTFSKINTIDNMHEMADKGFPTDFIQMLSDIYSRFDELVDNHETVFKLESRADCYMLAAGLLTDHSSAFLGEEMAEVALEMVNITKAFQPPRHLVDQMKIGIGIDIGPVVAGIVGSRTPRFCLYGNLIQTVCKLSETSEAYNIQLSATSYNVLHGARLELKKHQKTDHEGHRFNTYWLVGRSTDPQRYVRRYSYRGPQRMHIFDSSKRLSIDNKSVLTGKSKKSLPRGHIRRLSMVDEGAESAHLPYSKLRILGNMSSSSAHHSSWNPSEIAIAHYTHPFNRGSADSSFPSHHSSIEQVQAFHSTEDNLTPTEDDMVYECPSKRLFEEHFVCVPVDIPEENEDEV